MFVDGPEFVLVLAQLDTEGNILTKFQKHSTSGFGGDAITRNVYIRTVGRTNGRQRVPRPYEKLLWNTSRRANNIKKCLKRARKYRYSLSVHARTHRWPGGGEGLFPRPTGKLSSNTCPRNSNIPEYAYIITW